MQFANLNNPGGQGFGDGAQNIDGIQVVADRVARLGERKVKYCMIYSTYTLLLI